MKAAKLMARLLVVRQVEMARLLVVRLAILMPLPLLLMSYPKQQGLIGASTLMLMKKQRRKLLSGCMLRGSFRIEWTEKEEIILQVKRHLFRAVSARA